ncbi:hypothetical protein CsSME_00018710 [Camellia sinensis var. sinensis]
MAVELCSENSSPGLITSPRISFSHDLSQSDIVPIEQCVLRSNSSSGIDFNFCIRDGYDQLSSSADELFSDGKILPVQIRQKLPRVWSLSLGFSGSNIRFMLGRNNNKSDVRLINPNLGMLTHLRFMLFVCVL